MAAHGGLLLLHVFLLLDEGVNPTVEAPWFLASVVA
jgi:hypothetical protein